MALRDVDFDLRANADVVNDVLESELNEVELVVTEDLRESHGALRTNSFGARFELMKVLTRDVQASSEAGKRLLIRFADAGQKLPKAERATVQRLKERVRRSIDLLGFG